jgi:L-alanine-DL-glutamate epimerase-like enolase superfamily enzyme
MEFIQEIKINSLSFPLERPFSNHLRHIEHINGIYIRMLTSTDITGHSLIYGLGITPHKDIIKRTENDLAPILFAMNTQIKNGNDLFLNWNQFWKIYNSTIVEQEKLYALANIDIAIWDIYQSPLKIRNCVH